MSCVRLRLQLRIENILNDQPVKLLIYGYSLKRSMRETKGVEKDIHFLLGSSTDMTEENTFKGTLKFPLNQCRGLPSPVWGLMPLHGQIVETKRGKAASHRKYQHQGERISQGKITTRRELPKGSSSVQKPVERNSAKR